MRNQKYYIHLLKFLFINLRARFASLCGQNAASSLGHRHLASFVNFMNYRLANSSFTKFACSQIHALAKAARAALDKFTLPRAAPPFLITRRIHLSRPEIFACCVSCDIEPYLARCLYYLRNIGLVSRQIHDAAMRPNNRPLCGARSDFAAPCTAAANTGRKRPATA